MNTQTIIQPETEADGIDLLDDDFSHGICLACQPSEPGVPFDAACGRRVVDFSPIIDYIPPNACPECLQMREQPCRYCGRRFGE